MYRRYPYVCDFVDDYILRIPSLLRGSVENCVTSEVILILLVLYFLIPPTGDYTDVIAHVNPGEILHKNIIKYKLFLYFPKVGRCH